MLAAHRRSVNWINHGAFSLLNQVSAVLLGFGSIFFLVRIIPPSEVGVWVLFTSVGGILETLRIGFIRTPFVSMLVVADERDYSKIILNSLILHILLTCLIGVLLIASAELLAKFWYAENLELLFYIYSVNSFVLIAFFHFEYLLQSKLEFKAIFIANFVRLFILFAYILGYYIIDKQPSLVELASVQIFSTIVASVFSFQLIKGQMPTLTRSLFDIAILKKLFHLGKYTFGTNISSMLIKNTDSWMIGRLISTAGVAMYNPALRISNIVEVPTLAIANIVFPQVGNKMRESGVEGVQAIYYKSVSLILAVMLPVVLPVYFMAEFIIMILFGAEYMEAVPILQVTIFYTVLVPFSRQFGTIMDALQMPKLNFYISLLMAILNVVLNYYLLQSFGVIGAAYSTVISFCFIFIVCQAILYYKFKINTLKVFVELISWYTYGWHFLRSWLSGKVS
ncbi:MAG TPA: flippase [Cyclobacteriaceae bacterium]|nr:flippase [Cyclobacteriaceae bacterium]HRJ83514.1 flippase [Cyclobacteriaceae bacterium]